MSKLDNARTKINEIDRKIAELYEERMDAVTDVIAHKLEHNLPIFDETREQIVIDNNSKLIKNPKYIKYYKEFIKETMENSKKYQKTLSNQDIVGYQGTKGAFSHIASKKLFPDFKGKSYDSFESVVKALINEEIYVAVLPFENSYAGEVGEVFDILSRYECYIHATYDLKIDQNLLGVKGATISDIKTVYSHEQALMQCKEYLENNNIEIKSYANTALATKFISEKNDISVGAIASQETAEIYNLDILEENINTSKENTTRFVVLYKEKSTKGNRFSATFVTKHSTGALARVMSIIASEGYNLESIRSRSIANVPFEYYFYIEVVGNLEDEKTKNLIKQVSKECKEFKIIGSYFK